jgi:hypothetical protein
MARLPDRFDLWMCKARTCPDPARQADYVLGTLAGLKEWHFLNVGTADEPKAAEAEVEGHQALLVFSDAGRIEELVGESNRTSTGTPLPIITIPFPAAMTWCLERRAGLLVNPGDGAALVPFEELERFHGEWNRRGGAQASGFWIPNMTTQEEDFWQEHQL